jgi:phosphoribosyl-AMP cyclohydrolase / phosphoribosyl-ATP pyrophosphohydrolase
MLDIDGLNFAKGNGLVTVVAQDAATGALLMVAHADREAMERTVATGEMHYRSRTRGLWHKGATSGNVQRVVSLTPDCDGDAVLARVHPAGPACHPGSVSCFGAAGEAGDALGELDAVVAARAASGSARGAPPEEHDAAGPSTERNRSTAAPIEPPKPSYTQRLLGDRNLRLKKLGEEAVELATACADGDRARAAEEAADLIYHAVVALHGVGGSLADVRRVLADRRK